LRARIGAGEVPPPSEIAVAFGWRSDQVRERAISLGRTKVNIGRGFLGVQPAALFAMPVQRNGVDPLNGAAFYGYHAAVRWGVLVDSEGLTAFNSHWLIQDRWFALPTVVWEQIDQQQSVLRAFSPENMADGEPDRLALGRYPNPTLLQPVDDELVDRLDAWRDEALKSALSHSGVDEHLQILFAKLFVLRTIEDRGLAPQVTPLSAATDGPTTLQVRNLLKTFREARQHICSDLFDDVNIAEIPHYVISGIINDLYFPQKLSFTGARYNFSWIDSDVLGLAYEKYLSTILQPRPPTPQLDLFRESYRDVARISVRRAGGVYYTPTYLTKYLAGKCIDNFLRSAPDGSIPKIIDLACGSASFLVAAVDTLLDKFKARDPSKNWAREFIDGGYINGVDIDERQ